MTQTKKIVLGTQRAVNKAVEDCQAKGWGVERKERIPRGCTNKFNYILYLKKASI